MSGAAREGATFRGQPLVLLGLVVLGWAGLRVATWQTPFPVGAESAAMAATKSPPESTGGSPPRSGEPRFAGARHGEGAAGSERVGEGGPGEWLRRPLPAAAPARPGWGGLPSLAPADPPVERDAPRPSPSPLAAASGLSVGAANGHTLLLLAGLSRMELPTQMVAMLKGARAPAPPLLARRDATAARSEAQGRASSPLPAAIATAPGAVPAGVVPAIGAPRPARWTADAWLLLREDTASPRPAGFQSYGRSQAGAVLRYRLAPASRHGPQAHLRASTALDGGPNNLREREVAAGLSARPMPRVPVRVAAELRVADLATGTEIRPAAYAVTELPPIGLPLGARGELYLQGGWVGGTYETAFIDGQARIDRPVARLGPAELSAGGAVWGGAQFDTERLDAGPSASATISLGRVRARVSADYRFRVAGDAEPASGPALTLYAGF